MLPITEEYILLFNAITDAAETLRRLTLRLNAIQQQAEELYLARAESSPENSDQG